MEYFVYVLRSLKNNRLYRGMTNDLTKRLADHNSGKNISTKPYRPWEIIYSEKLQSREEARKREKYLKSGTGREFIKNLIFNPR